MSERGLVERVAERWTEDFAEAHSGPEMALHQWEDDARWFATAYAAELRRAGHEIASDWLRTQAQESPDE